MSLRVALEAVFLALACACALVSAAGVAKGEDALAKLIYGSIPGSTALVFLAVAMVAQSTTAMTVVQVLLLVVLSVVSGGVAGNRIAGVIRDRAKARGEAQDAQS